MLSIIKITNIIYLNRIPSSQKHNITLKNLILKRGPKTASRGLKGFFNLSSNTRNSTNRSSLRRRRKRRNKRRKNKGEEMEKEGGEKRKERFEKVGTSNLATSRGELNIPVIKAVFLKILSGSPVNFNFLTIYKKKK